MSAGKRSNWDDSLAKGKLGEDIVKDWLKAHYDDVEDVRDSAVHQQADTDFVAGGISIEVKTDYRANETGRLFLELDALYKSTAAIWIFYLPQRRWLLQFQRTDLVRAAESRYQQVMELTSERPDRGSTWTVKGMPVRITDLLLECVCILYTQVGGTG